MYEKILVPYDSSEPAAHALAQALELASMAPGAIVGDRDGVEIAVVNGSPHDAITGYANAGGYDCIAMGHRGMGAVRSMLGSVCYSVLQKTQVPVLIVK